MHAATPANSAGASARVPRRPGERVRASDLATLDDVQLHARACELCRLCRDRTQVVTSSGPASARVLVVADAPSYREDRSGVLLDGPVGDCFDAALAEAGLTRDEVYITSVIKCRPPLGRAPFPDEIEACEGWLFREISLVQPNIVVTLGGLALRLVTGRQERLANVHGQLVHTQLQGRDVVVWPLVHPAVAVQVASVATELREDARRLGELIRGASAGERASKQTPRAAESASAAEQSPPVDGETQLSFEVT